MANIKVHKSCPMHFYTSSNHFNDINVLNCLPSKVGHGHRVKFPQCRTSMSKIEIYKRHFFTFLIFAKMRPVITNVTYRQTHTHTHTETDKGMAIGDIADLPRILINLVSPDFQTFTA